MHEGGPGVTAEIERLVAAADIDELVRTVDVWADGGRWDDVVRLRFACRSALDTGRQLWPASSWAAYRLALGGPVELAASTVGWHEERFGPGPLTEVVAQDHTFAELGPHLGGGPAASVVAHERVARRETVPADRAPEPDVFEIPLAPAGWEPAWPLPAYTVEGLRRPELPPAPVGLAATSTGARPLGADEVTAALIGGVEHWRSASTGRVEAVAVEGGIDDAISALGVSRFRRAPVATVDALVRFFAAAGDGAAAGPRKGSAWARASTWWLAAALCGESDAEVIGDSLGEIEAAGWDAGAPATGWALQLAFADPVDGLAWAVYATDAR